MRALICWLFGHEHNQFVSFLGGKPTYHPLSCARCGATPKQTDRTGETK